MLMFSGMLVFIITLGISGGESKAWFYLAAPIIFVLIALVAFARLVFIPMMQGKITLELDDEKANCYLSDRTIYWKDVSEINDSYTRYSSSIVFTMMDGGEISVSAKWIAGNTRSIRKKMEEYFAQTL